jgi:hypothetical protein
MTRTFPHSCGGELVVLQIGRDRFSYRDSGKVLTVCQSCHTPMPVAPQIARTMRILRVSPDVLWAKALRNAVKYAPLLKGI